MSLLGDRLNTCDPVRLAQLSRAELVLPLAEVTRDLLRLRSELGDVRGEHAAAKAHAWMRADGSVSERDRYANADCLPVTMRLYETEAAVETLELLRAFIEGRIADGI